MRLIKYNVKKGPLSFRMVQDKPRKHHIGDMIEALCEDGTIERHMVSQGSGCDECDCFYDDTCIRWISCRKHNVCILQYGYGHIAQNMILKSIDNVMENI